MKVWDVELADGTKKSVITNLPPSQVGARFGNFKTPCARYKVVDYQHLADGFPMGKVIDKSQMPYRDDGGYTK